MNDDQQTEDARARLIAMGVAVPDDWTDEQAIELLDELREAETAEPVYDDNPFAGIEGGASPRG